MSDSHSPAKPGPVPDSNPQGRPDLFASGDKGGRPPRREDTVRILSTRKPANDGNRAKNTRPLWFSASAVVCAVAVAGWYGSRGDPGPAKDEFLSASASPASVVGAPASASLKTTASTALASPEFVAQVEQAPIVATQPQPAETVPGPMAPGVESGAVSGAMSSAVSGVVSGTAALAAVAGQRASPKGGSVVASKPASRSSAKTGAKTSSPQGAKESARAKARREEAARRARIQRAEGVHLARSTTPAAEVAASPSTGPAPHRDSETDAKVIEALLPYVKRSQAKVGGRSASSAVSGGKTPATGR